MEHLSNFPWNKLIDEALITQEKYLLFDEWLKNELYLIFNSDVYLNCLLKYKCLVLLNRSIKNGRYALIFNKQINESCINKDRELLIKTLSNPPLLELDFLSASEKEKWLTELNNHIMALNLYADRLVISQNELYNFNNENDYKKCYSDVCSLNSNIKANYLYLPTRDIITISDFNKYTEIFLILEIDLMFIILSNGVNPYTGKNFSDYVLTNLKKHYTDILNVCRNAHKLGYRHTYKL